MEGSKMPSTVKVADITEGFDNKEIHILCHQVNCFNTWGAGLARQLKKKYPRAYEADCFTVKGDQKKLGQFTFAFIDRDQLVVNLYGQYKWGRKGKFTNEEALLKALENLISFLQKMDMGKAVIGFPEGIGCGLAGGNWEEVKPLIEYAFTGTDFQVVYYKLP
jgi:O-acetyl-ADP-ribose deacetylase (regulator of RNase III)